MPGGERLSLGSQFWPLSRARGTILDYLPCPPSTFGECGPLIYSIAYLAPASSFQGRALLLLYSAFPPTFLARRSIIAWLSQLIKFSRPLTTPSPFFLLWESFFWMHQVATYLSHECVIPLSFVPSLSSFFSLGLAMRRGFTFPGFSYREH